MDFELEILIYHGLKDEAQHNVVKNPPLSPLYVYKVVYTKKED